MQDIPNKPGIYKLTNKLNNKIYIGETNNLFGRILHSHKYGSKQVIGNAIKKHGWENFEVEIIDVFDYDDGIERLALETAYIIFYNSLTPNQGGNGYNVSKCGRDRTDFKHTEESKKKMSESRKGKYCGQNHPNFRKQFSKEIRKKISDATKDSKIKLIIQTGGSASLKKLKEK